MLDAVNPMMASSHAAAVSLFVASTLAVGCGAEVGPDGAAATPADLRCGWAPGAVQLTFPRNETEPRHSEHVGVLVDDVRGIGEPRRVRVVGFATRCEADHEAVAQRRAQAVLTLLEREGVPTSDAVLDWSSGECNGFCLDCATSPGELNFAQQCHRTGNGQLALIYFEICTTDGRVEFSAPGELLSSQPGGRRCAEDAVEREPSEPGEHSTPSEEIPRRGASE